MEKYFIYFWYAPKRHTICTIDIKSQIGWNLGRIRWTTGENQKNVLQIVCVITKFNGFSLLRIFTDLFWVKVHGCICTPILSQPKRYVLSGDNPWSYLQITFLDDLLQVLNFVGRLPWPIRTFSERAYCSSTHEVGQLHLRK